MAEGTFGVGSAGGADKAAVAASEALGPGAYGGAGWGGAKVLRMAIDAAKGRVPVESEKNVRGPHELGPQREDTSGHGKDAAQ